MVDLNQSGCGTPGLLQGFVNYWNDNRSSINRDVAQLFSGTGLECSGGRCVIGCAYIGQLCNIFSYGVNYATFSGNANSVEVLVAHELGHNCGAQHYNIQDHIMFPSVNPSGQGFSQTSVNSFLDLFSRSPCIGVEATESPASEEGEQKAQKDGLLFMECSAKAGYNVKSLFRKLATSLPGSVDPNNGANGSGGGGAGGPNLIDIKLSQSPVNLDDAKQCGC